MFPQAPVGTTISTGSPSLNNNLFVIIVRTIILVEGVNIIIFEGVNIILIEGVLKPGGQLEIAIEVVANLDEDP